MRDGWTQPCPTLLHKDLRTPFLIPPAHPSLSARPGKPQRQESNVPIHLSKLQQFLFQVSKTIKHTEHRKRHPEHSIKHQEKIKQRPVGSCQISFAIKRLSPRLMVLCRLLYWFFALRRCTSTRNTRDLSYSAQPLLAILSPDATMPTASLAACAPATLRTSGRGRSSSCPVTVCQSFPTSISSHVKPSFSKQLQLCGEKHHGKAQCCPAWSPSLGPRE